MLNILLALQDPHTLLPFLKAHQVDLLSDPAALETLAVKNNYHIVILEGSIEQISAVKALDPRVEVIYLGKKEEEAIGAVKKGATSYLTYPVSPEKIQEAVARIEASVTVRKKTGELEQQLVDSYTHHGITGKNPQMLDLISFLRNISTYYQILLVTGETGTGKEVVAKALHELSPVSSHPFITCNCGGLVEHLIESELFGHQKGAFTGADRDKMGLFEAAGEGTLFLDEIGELPLSFQPHLLRVLQNGEYRRVGSQKSGKARCRIIAATHRPLDQEVEEGRFREDLYFRITPLVVKIPPLRDRKDDLLLLSRVFLNRFNKRTGKRVNGISRPAQTALLSYDWPGNIRELENTIERAALLTTESFIRPEDFPSRLMEKTASSLPSLLSLADAEKHHIRKVLELHEGNRTKSAAILRISRRALIRKIEKYNL